MNLARRFRVCVRTESGSDRIIKFRWNYLIPSLPLAVLTQTLNAWAREIGPPVNQMRVLIADKFEQSGRDGLQALGCEISFQPDLKDAALVEAIARQQPDELVVRGTKVTEAMLAAAPLKLVVRAGAGYNTI